MKTTIETREIKGVNFRRENGKWVFDATKTNGQTYSLSVTGKASLDKAEKVASAIGACVKRNFTSGSGMDGLAQSQIRKVINAPTYNGINFSHAQ